MSLKDERGIQNKAFVHVEDFTDRESFRQFPPTLLNNKNVSCENSSSVEVYLMISSFD